MNVFLHIGLHKTGTTYLQVNIFPKLDGFQYIHLPPWQVLAKEKLSPAASAEFKKETLKDWDGISKLMISSEYFSGQIEKFTKKEMATILDNLKVIFPDAEVVLVLRNPKGYLNSLYNFRVVTRGTCARSKSSYYKQNKKYLLEKFDYDYLMSFVKDRFKKLHVIKYEQIKDNNQYVEFICKVVNIPIFQVSNDVKENTSSKKSIAVKSHLIINRLFLTRLIEFFPESHFKNYLKVRFFNFKKTKAIKKFSKYLESFSFVMNKENNLTAEQEAELGKFVKRYEEFDFS